MLTRSPSRCGMLVLAGRGAHRTKMVRNGLLTELKVKPSKNSAQDEDEDATKGGLNMVLHTMGMFSHSIATESMLGFPQTNDMDFYFSHRVHQKSPLHRQQVRIPLGPPARPNGL